MYLKVLPFFIVFALNGQQAIHSAQDREYVLADVVSLISEQLSLFPQEKLHLHTDRDFYVPGERIWFRAYLTDATTHQLQTQSRYVYAELISPADTLVSRVMVRPDDNGVFHGHIFLSEIIPEGDYTLRAYTRYMENLGDDYFFKKNLRIGNLASAKATESSQRRRNDRETRDDFEVSFFPEGGNLLDGTLNKVAFKALNRNGRSEIISGEIVDESGTVISSVETLHAGMGVFVYVPSPEKRYYLNCRNDNGLEKRFELPQSQPRAYSLSVSQRNKKIVVGIRQSADAPNISGYLLAQCRGMVLYFDVWNKEKEYVSFSEEDLPSGVIQFLLFDEQMNPLSERLAFNRNYDEATATVDFKTDKEFYEMREKVISNLLLDVDGNSLNGSLSVAVTDDTDIDVDNSTTILSSLLLSSELKGYIENPAWYLRNDVKSTVALDYLMKTHGWRRYDIPEVIRENIEQPSISRQTSQTITGYVRSRVILGDVADNEIMITSEAGDFGLTATNETGAFAFNDFEYPDSTSFFLQALSSRGNSRNVEIFLDDESFPALAYAPQSPVTASQVSDMETETDPFLEKAEQRSRFDEDMWQLNLSELVITAPKTVRSLEAWRGFWADAFSDATVRRSDFEELRYPTTSEYLNLFPGVQTYRNAYGQISVITRLTGVSGTPLIVIDGVAVGLDDLDAILPPSDLIERIDFYRFAGASMYGVRASHGVISITTRTDGGSPGMQLYNSAVHTPLGYQKPIEFYSPKYETLEAKQSVIPDYRTTIFWKPDVVISEEGEASFEFYTADFPTTYSVVIEGLTDDGRIVRQVEKIQVK